MPDELDNLLVSGEELDRKLVADILSPYVRIDKEALSIRPLSPWNDLKAYNKILIFLLSKKAMKALGLSIEEEAASTTEVIKNTGLISGTVYPALKSLLEDDRVIARAARGKYFIPNYALEKVKQMITEK